MDVSLGGESERVLTALAARRFTPWRDVSRRLRARRRRLARGFDRLLALEEIAVTPFPHQRAAALTVLRQMRGRALLADEVGLGKTIEAGLVLKELLIRGLARSALILAPAPLLEQWREELAEKFGIAARVARLEGAGDESAGDRCVIASLDWAKRPERAARLQASAWDVVIVDEAHRLKNRRTAAWRFVDGLRKKYLLLLTATPIQNDLEELYNLVTLLKPGLLQTYTTFRQRFMAERRRAKDVEQLRDHVADVMIRTTRRDCGLELPPRRVQAAPVRLSEPEKAFYRDVLAFARRAYARKPRGEALPLIVLLRELCSSPRAAARTLALFANSEDWAAELRLEAAALAQRAASLEGRTAKLEQALRLLSDWREPAIVFTEFRATQQLLGEALQSRGVPVTLFHGGMSDAERRAALDGFQARGGVLISTEAGGEGQNWQFCRFVLNYDLPWNPMRLEQRIGRIHRLGQTRPASVVNLYTEDTVEAHVYRLLEEKIGLFRQVIGELDWILAAEDDGAAFEATVGHLALAARDEAELAGAFERLGRRLEARRARREAVLRRNAAVLDGQGIGARPTAPGLDEEEGTLGQSAPPAPTEGAVGAADIPVACLVHPLALDPDFAAGVLGEGATAHEQARCFHRRRRQVRFGNGETCREARRLVLQRQLVVWFTVAYKFDETQEELWALAVDSLTEQVRLLDEVDRFTDAHLEHASCGGAPADYELRRLYRRALQGVRALAARAGRRHVAEARARLERDRARIEAYFAGLRDEALAEAAQRWRKAEAARLRERLRRALWTDGPVAESAGEGSAWEDGEELGSAPAGAGDETERRLRRIEAERLARLEELEKKYEVRAEAAPVAAALLWAPKVECRYKLAKPSREVVVYYDPLTGSLIDWACEACGEGLETAWLCEACRELVCSRCHAPCAGCGKSYCFTCAPARCHVCDAGLCPACAATCPALPAEAAAPLAVCPACREDACRRCTRMQAFLVV